MSINITKESVKKAMKNLRGIIADPTSNDKEEENKQYQITCNKEQLKTIMMSLELESRLYLGQFDKVILNPFMESMMEKHLGSWDKVIEKRSYIEGYLDVLEEQMLGLTKGQSHAIGSKKIPNHARIAYEIMGVIRHFFWKQRGEKSKSTVDAYPPLACSGEEFIEVNEKK
jgi:hypothetical protein